VVCVQGAGCRVQGAECRVQGAGCQLQSARCRVQGVNDGAWCRVEGRGSHVALEIVAGSEKLIHLPSYLLPCTALTSLDSHLLTDPRV